MASTIRLVRRVANRLTDVGRKIDNEFAVHDEVVIGLFEVEGEHLCKRIRAWLLINKGLRTMTTNFQVEHIANTNIHDSEETLVALLELALVEYLHGDHRRVLDGAIEQL